MTRYDFLDARFVIWLAIDLLLVNIWFWAKNDQIWQPEARWMIFSNIRTDFNFIFVQFSVARKLILNGGAIRPTGLLLMYLVSSGFSFKPTSSSSSTQFSQEWARRKVVVKHSIKSNQSRQPNKLPEIVSPGMNVNEILWFIICYLPTSMSVFKHVGPSTVLLWPEISLLFCYSNKYVF